MVRDKKTRYVMKSNDQLDVTTLTNCIPAEPYLKKHPALSLNPTLTYLDPTPFLSRASHPFNLTPKP